MSKTDIGPKIGIDGEAQFRREIAQINTDLKTLGSEMKVVTSEFVGNEQSTEALTAKNQVLEATVVELTQKQQLLYEQMQKSAAAYGSADARTQKLTQQYNDTTAQINTLNAQIDRNNSQINTSSTLFGKLGGKVGDLAKQFGLSSTAAGKLTSVLGSQASVYTAIAGAVIKLVSALNDLAEKQAAVIDQTNTLATKYHTTAQAIETFNYASKFVDVSTETMLGSMTKLTRSMDSARDGTGSAAKAFEQLGVSITNQDGSLRSSHDVFLQVIDSLKAVGNETERDALAMEVFGKSAQEIAGVIEAGSDGLKQYADQAEFMGLVISEQANRQLQSLQDTTDRYNALAEATATNLAARWAPVKQTWIDIKSGWMLLLNKLLEFDDAASGSTAANLALANSAKTAGNEIRSQADALDEVTAAGKKTRSMYDDLKDTWAELQAQGFGKVIASYDPETGVKREYFASNAEYAAYRNGASFNDIYSGAYNTQPQQVTVDVTLEIDSQKLAQTSIDAFRAENERRGPGAMFQSNNIFG